MSKKRGSRRWRLVAIVPETRYILSRLLTLDCRGKKTISVINFRLFPLDKVSLDYRKVAERRMGFFEKGLNVLGELFRLQGFLKKILFWVQ